MYIFYLINLFQPFGKRSGLKKNNKSLYHRVLLELGRVVRPTVGRAVLLTHDRRSFEIVRKFCVIWFPVSIKVLCKRRMEAWVSCHSSGTIGILYSNLQHRLKVRIRRREEPVRTEVGI